MTVILKGRCNMPLPKHKRIDFSHIDVDAIRRDTISHRGKEYFRSHMATTDELRTLVQDIQFGKIELFCWDMGISFGEFAERVRSGVYED